MPTLFPDVIWLWSAFSFLSQRRQYGFSGPLPISVLEMQAYLNLKGIKKEDDIDLFLRVIPLLDDAWLTESYRTKQTEQDTKNKTRR